MHEPPAPDRDADTLTPEMWQQLHAAQVEPEAFAQEQAALGRCWTFLGFAHQVPARNDWFTATLGGRTIFVQRFEPGVGSEGLAAFENRCAHRGYPLKIGEKGNGPVLCGFHHWRYNNEGLALGIPHCPEMFGCTPREMNARLEPVELALCGEFIFGRFGSGPTLEAWLGPAYSILRHISGYMHKPAGMIDCRIAANWRTVMEISLDDYHIVAVHPATFGKEGYIPAEEAFYTRFGAHSAYFRGGDAESLPQMVRDCEAGTFFPQRYRILQLFPSLVVTFVHAIDYLGEGYWYTIVLQIIPEGPGRTRSRSRYFPIPHPPTTSRLRRWLRALALVSLNPAFGFNVRRVNKEDNVACEHLQSGVQKNDPPPRLARHEQRIGWFAQAYARVMRGETPLP